MQKIYDIREAAEKIGRSMDTLRDWDRQGRLRAGRVAGRRIYTDEDVARGRQIAQELDAVRPRGLRGAPREAA